MVRFIICITFLTFTLLEIVSSSNDKTKQFQYTGSAANIYNTQIKTEVSRSFLFNRTLSITDIIENKSSNININKCKILINDQAIGLLTGKNIIIEDSLLILNTNNKAILLLQHDNPEALLKYYFNNFLLNTIEYYNIVLKDIRVK
jgi:hypothetical protein